MAFSAQNCEVKSYGQLTGTNQSRGAASAAPQLFINDFGPQQLLGTSPFAEVHLPQTCITQHLLGMKVGSSDVSTTFH